MRRKHGLRRTPEYDSWRAMMMRCYNTDHPKYANYGGRGIRVCLDWHDFAIFLRDMGQRPTKAHTLERINSDIGYAPGNCKWATRQEQNRNKRDNLRVTIDGETKLLIEWCEHPDAVAYDTAWQRIVKYGWTAKRAVFTPSTKQKRISA